MTDAVLRQAPRPLVHALDHGIAANAKEIAEFGTHQRDEFPSLPQRQVRRPVAPEISGKRDMTLGRPPFEHGRAEKRPG